VRLKTLLLCMVLIEIAFTLACLVLAAHTWQESEHRASHERKPDSIRNRRRQRGS